MNKFSKEERVAFEQLVQGFRDALVMSRNVTIRKMDQVMAERSGDTVWYPMPYNLPAYNGRDMTANFLPNTQLSVPTVINQEKCVPWPMSPTELRDMLQNDRLRDAAKRRLATEINLAVGDVASLQGTLFVGKATAASGFADIAAIEGAMNRVGIPGDARVLFLPTFDYNGLAADLANRQNMTDLPKEAYRRAYVGMVASFDTYKLDHAYNLDNADGGGSITMDTRTSAANYYTPRATDANGNNVDNRYQTVTWSSTTDVSEGDRFTIAGVYEVHHETKRSTGNLKTFVVTDTDLAAGTVEISPPIVSNQGGTRAEIQYQNVEVTAASNAAITFLNTVTKAVSPFWHKDAIVLTPGKYVVPPDSGVGVMRATLDGSGLEVVMTKWFDIKTYQMLIRVDVRYGVTMAAPEMAGIAMFSQT